MTLLTKLIVSFLVSSSTPKRLIRKPDAGREPGVRRDGSTANGLSGLHRHLVPDSDDANEQNFGTPRNLNLRLNLIGANPHLDSQSQRIIVELWAPGKASFTLGESEGCAVSQANCETAYFALIRRNHGPKRKKRERAGNE